MSKIKFYTSDGQMYFEMEEEKVNKEQKIQELSNKIEKSRVEIDALKEELEKLQKKPYKISYPDNGTEVYIISDLDGGIEGRKYDVSDNVDEILYELGLYFDTYEETEQFKRERALIKKIKCWAKEQQGDWKPGWSDCSNNNFSIYYDGQNEKLRIHVWKVSNILSTLPCFKSEEIAQACIDEFGDEILEVFC